MLQLNNTTRFAASTAWFPNEEGVDTLYVMVRATFNIAKEFTLADDQPKPTATDVYWTEAGKSSLKYGSDMHTGKPTTDIVMLGHACAPAQKEVHELDVSLSVGELSKTVRVFGDRQWKEGKITAPALFKTMAMVYEKAFGGIHMVDGKIDSAEDRNPVGRGFAGKRTLDEMNGVPLPNLEDPGQLIRAPTDKPNPACYGFCAPNWNPRAQLAGTYDEVWRKTRAPYLPEDFNKRFLNMAHPDLIYPGFLHGGEPVQISGMHPGGVLQFDVPRVRITTRVILGDKAAQPDFNLETLLLEPNQMKLGMLWRAALPCDKRVIKVSNIKVELSR
jgi:hypothetical protein